MMGTSWAPLNDSSAYFCENLIENWKSTGRRSWVCWPLWSENLIENWKKWSGTRPVFSGGDTSFIEGHSPTVGGVGLRHSPAKEIRLLYGGLPLLQGRLQEGLGESLRPS